VSCISLNTIKINRVLKELAALQADIKGLALLAKPDFSKL
jgi:hypothetical protein